MNAPELRRHEAINGTVAQYLDQNHELIVCERAGVAVSIRLLERYGRSPKWKTAVTRWADMVADDTNDLRWALLQGSVGATIAA